ncbi:hypothetical protein RP20_CCG019334 [Aedes albopictus]|nr:hypothetical protein RP20_CCG019334 [Aedes albopictus]
MFRTFVAELPVLFRKEWVQALIDRPATQITSNEETFCRDFGTRDEVQEVRQTRDPISSFKDKIVNAGLVTADELKKIDAAIKKEVDEATAAAKADAEIGLPELSTDVYANNLEGYIRGASPSSWLKHSSLNKAVNM